MVRPPYDCANERCTVGLASETYFLNEDRDLVRTTDSAPMSICLTFFVMWIKGRMTVERTLNTTVIQLPYVYR